MIVFFGIFLVIPILENIYAEDDFSKRSLSNSLYHNTDNHQLENNNIPNQFIVYLRDSEDESKSIDPLEFYNSELKDTGTELLHIYNNVAKGFAIKVPNEKVLEELKSNPLVEYIGQDKKVSAFKDSPMEIQIIPEKPAKE
ncbi:MAG: protease inhibitor I9 family protein [Deltaproteobacteria bacterium]|jgi:peptidase inhibitor I9